MLFISKTLPYSFCACVQNTPKIVTFVIGKMKLVSFSLFLELKDIPFIFPMTNVTILGVFRTHAQKEYGKVWEMKSMPILNILAHLLF